MTNNTTAPMMTTTNDDDTYHVTGDRVTVWTGETGTVMYFKGGWYGVKLDGEKATYEWQPFQVAAA